MKRLILSLLWAMTIVGAGAQEFEWSVDFDMNFDNREYASLSVPSQTLFGARLTPMVGFGWDEGRNALMAGVDVVKTFGRDRFSEDPQLVLYYAYRSQRFRATAGVFPRRMMLGDYSPAIFSDSVRFYDNNLDGLLLQYTGERGFAELGVDWDGAYSKEEREKFRIFSSGRIDRGEFVGGYTLSVYHFAGREGVKGVVDNIAVEPYVGFDMKRLLPLDCATVTAGWLQTMQRDRISGEKGVRPAGGELRLKVEKWHAGIDNRLYVGDDLMPYFSRYGGELYAGERFYSLEGGTSDCYDRLEFYYDRLWSTRAVVGLHVGFVFHFAGGRVVTQQVLRLNVAINKGGFMKKRNTE